MAKTYRLTQEFRGHNAMNHRSVTLAAILLAIGSGSAFADVGDLRTSVSYNALDSEYKNFNDAADRDSYMITTRGTYTYSDKLKLGFSVGLGNSEAKRAVGFFSTDTDIETYALNASYQLAQNWSVFAGIGYTELETDGTDNNNPATRFSVDGDGFSYVGGAIYDRDLSDNMFFLLSSSVSYSEISTDAFTSFFNVAPSKNSVTTIFVSPEVGYVHGDFTFAAGLSYVRANRDFRLVDDPTRYEANLDISYDLGNDWYVTGGVGRNFSEKSTRAITYTLNVSKTISLLK